MKKIIISIVFPLLTMLYSCSGETQKAVNTIDYSEIDSIAQVDAARFIRAVYACKTEMQLEDEILKTKDKEREICEQKGKQISDRYVKTFRETVEQKSDTIASLIFR
ncbi:MAG: hypothetical protein ACI30S_03775 [Muribaculaceae bacterium]